MRRIAFNTRILVASALVGGLLAVALWPRPLPVDVATAERGPLVVTVDEEGMTRVRDRYVVSSPVFGQVMRIDLRSGDLVRKGQRVALVRAQAPPLLDDRERKEAQAAVESASAALGRARAGEQQARATAAQLHREAVRMRELAAERVVSAQELETYETQLRAADESVNAAVFAVRAAAFDLQRAQARVAPIVRQSIDRIVAIESPVSGVVLRQIRESESVVPGGEPLLEIGDPTRLEIVSDLLSTDAVRIKPGARAIVSQWGGDDELQAVVRRVEPAGFTKVSALGVEEQRVNVILDFVEPEEACAALGDAYRVEVRIVIWEAAVTVKIPTAALFRSGQQWAVYRIAGNRAQHTVVTVGHRTGQEAEITAGLAAGDRVIIHPSDTLMDGSRVVLR